MDIRGKTGLNVHKMVKSTYKSVERLQTIINGEVCSEIVFLVLVPSKKKKKRESSEKSHLF